MDAVTLPSEMPSELKAIDLLVKRANELKTHDSVMAYWCKHTIHTVCLISRRTWTDCDGELVCAAGCFWAVEVGVSEKRSKPATAVLMQLLDALEQVSTHLVAFNDL